MKSIMNLIGNVPVIVVVCVLLLAFGGVFKIAGCVAAKRSAEMEYEYYDVGYSYRTAVIEANEEAKAVIEADRAFVESLPEGEEKEDYIRVFNKRYSRYGVELV
jgi:hypothetical protein